MTSREIAELTGKMHFNVLNDIRSMLDELGRGDLEFQGSYLSAQNKPLPQFLLPKDLTLTLVAGYSVPLRQRIVTRWLELEAQVATQLPHAKWNERRMGFYVPSTKKGVHLRVASRWTKLAAWGCALFWSLPGAAHAERYPGKPDCEALRDPGEAVVCMDKYADCSTPSWLSGAARSACLAEASAMQQGLKVFRRESLEAVLNQKERAKLKAADLAYERYIQAQCELEASPVFGGSMYAGELQTCLYRLREQRVADYPRMHQNFSSWRNQ